MKVSVLGAGAIGSMFGGLLRQHNPELELVLVARGEHGAAMRNSGKVGLIGPWGRYDVPVMVTDKPAEIRRSDLVLFTVKSQATEEAIRAAAPFIDDAIVVSIQNGINHRILAQFIRHDSLVMGMTATNMAVLEPGSVSLQLNGATILGSVPGRDATKAVGTAATLLRSTGLPVDPHPNVLGVQYNKLAINVLGYASCLSASNFITEAILDKPWRRSVALPLLRECIAAYDAAGIELARIPGVPDVYGFRRFLRLLEVPLLGAALRAGARAKFNRKPIVFSLYQDLLRKKATEIDFINGEIVRLLNERGGDAPYNALVVQMVHELEARGDGTFFSRDEVIQRFEALK